MPEEWKKEIITKLRVKHHRHPLPVCKSGNHDSSCTKYGTEISCIKIIKSYNRATGRLDYEALCTHLIIV